MLFLCYAALSIFRATWKGIQEAAEGKDIGIDFQDFSWTGYDCMLPNDFNIYLLRNIKGEANDWKHGQKT